MPNPPQNLTRNILQQMAPNQRAIRALEQALTQVNDVLPTDLQAVQSDAGNALAASSAALDAVQRIANALELIATLPPAPQPSPTLADDMALLAGAQQQHNSARTDYTDFGLRQDHPAWKEGRLYYDYSDHSLAYYNDDGGVNVNIGREQLVRIYNSTGSTLLNGQLTYISGATSGWPTVTLAKADTKIASQATLGMITADIAAGQYGYVCVSGIVNDLNTSAYAPGTRLYLSATTAGAVTSTPPLQPNYVVEVATVVDQNATTGRLFIHIDKQAWFPYVEIRDTSATITLPTTPTVFKPSTTVVNDGFAYDNTTGILTINESGSYAISIQFNAKPSASNKNIYFYAEDSTDGGTTWNITRYSGRQLELVNAVETQVNINSARYYATGTKLRFNIWGDATVTLYTTDLPGTTPGTVTKPAYRFLMA